MQNLPSSVHPSVAFLKAFESPFLAVDKQFWRIVDGARKHLKPEFQDHAYVSMDGIAQQLSSHREIIVAVVDRAMVAQPNGIPSSNDGSAASVNAARAAWEQAVHDMGYRIAAMGAFRASKQVIQMASGLEKDLAERTVSATVRASDLLSLPSWAFYIELGEEAKSQQGLSTVDGVFVSLFQEDDKVIMNLTAVGADASNTTAPLTNIRMTLSETNYIGRFIDDMKQEAQAALNTPNTSNEKTSSTATEMGWQLLRFSTNVALHLSQNTPEYVGEEKLSTPIAKKSFSGVHFSEPGQIKRCHISASPLLHAASRARDYVEQKTAGQPTLTP